MATTGIDSNFITDAIIGASVAGGLILLSFISPFISTIGIPSISQSVSGELGRWLIVVLVASIAEEIFFREFILDFFDNKLKAFGLNLPFFLAAIISSILFSLFHFVAYNSSLSAAGGSFISAALAGMVFAYSKKWTNSVITPIVAHMVLNFYILSQLAVVIG